jgi:hypothetical protein
LKPESAANSKCLDGDAVDGPGEDGRDRCRAGRADEDERDGECGESDAQLD